MLRLLLIACSSALVLSACQTARSVVAAPEANPGPCPNALSLYDAHRLVQINGENIVFENVGFTGEILNVTSTCRYTNRDASPINAEVEVVMGFGRGPAAGSRTHTYELFLAVTGFNDVVVDKKVFPIEVTFGPDEDRVQITERFNPVLIPRASSDTSGVNFEMLVGFELTEEELEFNRSGLRFRVDAGQD